MDNRDHNPDRTDEQDLGNPLGISGAPVTPDAPEHLKASDDEAEARRRRNRALSADQDETRRGMDDVNYDHKGATGIDLGGAERGTK